MYLCCHKWQLFALSYGWVEFHSIYPIFLNQPSIKGHLGVFGAYLLYIATVNIMICISLQINISKILGRYPKEGLVSRFLIFEETMPFLLMTVTIHIPITFRISTSSSTLMICLIDNAILIGMRWFGFVFLLKLMKLSIFSNICWSFLCLLGKIVCSVPNIQFN